MFKKKGKLSRSRSKASITPLDVAADVDDSASRPQSQASEAGRRGSQYAPETDDSNGEDGSYYEDCMCIACFVLLKGHMKSAHRPAAQLACNPTWLPKALTLSRFQCAGCLYPFLFLQHTAAYTGDSQEGDSLAEPSQADSTDPMLRAQMDGGTAGVSKDSQDPPTKERPSSVARFKRLLTPGSGRKARLLSSRSGSRRASSSDDEDEAARLAPPKRRYDPGLIQGTGNSRMVALHAGVCVCGDSYTSLRAG